MRSASSAGSVLASHNPQDMPRIAIVLRKTHAAGQRGVPAGTNNSAPMTTIQIRFCSNSFAIMRRSRSDADNTMIAPFSGKLATVGFPRNASSEGAAPLVNNQRHTRESGYPVIAAVRKNLGAGILVRPVKPGDDGSKGASEPLPSDQLIDPRSLSGWKRGQNHRLMRAGIGGLGVRFHVWRLGLAGFRHFDRGRGRNSRYTHRNDPSALSRL